MLDLQPNKYDPDIKPNSHLLDIKPPKSTEMPKSPKKLVKAQPPLRKVLGRIPNKNNNVREVESRPLTDELNSDSPKKNGEKRPKTSTADSDDADCGSDTFSTLVGSSNKLRKVEYHGKKTEPVVVKPKLQLVERRLCPVLKNLSLEELMETNTYRHFDMSVANVLELTNDIDFNEFTEDEIIHEEYLVPPDVMQELCSEAATLKTSGAMQGIPTVKLSRFLNILELNIRGGDRVSPITNNENESLSITQKWLESTMERVLRAADACLICMYVMTSPNMPKRIYLEEVIDRVMLFMKYHLYKTIFPSFELTRDVHQRNSSANTDKSILVLYKKVCELVGLLAELLNIIVLTDTSISHASSIGVSSFLVENVTELQLACLNLLSTIFTRYKSQRNSLLDDILASIAGLPKRSLRMYRLNSNECIQMITALVLQLTQRVVTLSEAESTDNIQDKTQQKLSNVDYDILICTQYEEATSTADTFLEGFLNKCANKNEIDHRPLFEHFVQDLLLTVNKPEWPAAELLLSQLGQKLIHNLLTPNLDVALRLVSLDYLGVIAVRLRREMVLWKGQMVETIAQLIKDIQEESKENIETPLSMKNFVGANSEEGIQFLQCVLLDFLAVNSQNDELYKFARHLYISQWYQDVADLVDESKVESESEIKNKCKNKSVDQKLAEKFRQLDDKKKLLVAKIKPFEEMVSSGNSAQVCQTYIDYESAGLIAQYLASKRNYKQSFDFYLETLRLTLKDRSIAVRTKGIKCLKVIVEADPSVLDRPELQKVVNDLFLDISPLVREAAVDLVGKVVLAHPELINKYYQMLSTRVRDTGVSVRKRVMRILRDICIQFPECPKIPDILVKMIQRLPDVEEIRLLAKEVFRTMWFTPTTDAALLLKKVVNITDAVASLNEMGLEWFEKLLLHLFKPKEEKMHSTTVRQGPSEVMLLAGEQIVDCCIENLFTLNENSSMMGSLQRLVACSTMLHLFAKIRPHFLVKHASTLQPYLGLECLAATGDTEIISNLAKILELVVPLMEHPSKSFLTDLEVNAMKLILSHDSPIIIRSCFSCIASLTNEVTKNYQFVRCCFSRCNGFLVQFKEGIEEFGKSYLENTDHRTNFRRSIYIVGFFLRHFDLQHPEIIGDLDADVKDRVFETMIYFLKLDDTDVQTNTVRAIGSICIRYFDFLLNADLKAFYHKQLIEVNATPTLKFEILSNIESYIYEEENRMIQQDLQWSKTSKHESLKEMNDESSEMTSTIIQYYLKGILESYLHRNLQVRNFSMRVIQLILQQGLVHPVQIVPYLVCMSTDTEKVISHVANKQLSDLDNRHLCFVNTKSACGIKLSYQLQHLLQDDALVRGFRLKGQGECPSALHSYFYSILRSSRQQRRALILNMLKQFDEQSGATLDFMLYLADNLAYLPYQIQDEPLFIIYHIDIVVASSGTNLLESFSDGLLENENGETSQNVCALDEDDDDEDALFLRLPTDITPLQGCLTAAQGVTLLLLVKHYLKEIYTIGDCKIQQYTPSEGSKVYQKAVVRKANTLFNPGGALQKIQEGTPPEFLHEAGRRDLIRQYLEFKQLMLQLDSVDDSDNE